MSVQLQCDMCFKKPKELEEIMTINEAYQVGDRIKHVCKDCASKIQDKLKGLAVYYGRQTADDVREWLLEKRTQNEAKLPKKRKETIVK